MSIKLADFEAYMPERAARLYYEAAVAAHQRAGVDPASLSLKVTDKDYGQLKLAVTGIKDGEIYDWVDIYVRDEDDSAA